jgi:hypothetical protein
MAKQEVQDQQKRKPTLESLKNDNQVFTGKDLLKKAEDKRRQEALYQEAVEFEVRHRRTKR